MDCRIIRSKVKNTKPLLKLKNTQVDFCGFTLQKQNITKYFFLGVCGLKFFFIRI